MPARLRTRRFHGLLLLLPAGLAACDPITTYVCTSDAPPAVRLEVRDSVTQAPAAAGATAYLQEGAERVPLHPLGDLMITGANMRTGTFEVVVEKPGYARWARAGVQVPADQCHRPQTAELKVRLQPAQ